jgi:hypothetical protein
MWLVASLAKTRTAPSPFGAVLDGSIRDVGSRLPERVVAGQNLASAVDAAVGSRYGESNRRTAELTGVDLPAFGYDLATGE